MSVYCAAMRGLFVPLVLFACFGCASQTAAVVNTSPAPALASPPLPAYLADPDHIPPPSCSANEHLWATGQSSQGRDAALLLAKKNLLSQLNSTIRVQAETFSSDISVNGKNTSEFRQVARVLEKIDFAHADLIRVAEAPVDLGGQTYVAVCLPRAQAIARLETDVAPEVKRFDTWYEAAERASGPKDPPAFVTAFGNLAAAMVAASPTLVQMRALAQGATAMGQHMTSAWLTIVTKVEDWRSRVRFTLSCETDARLHQASAQVTEAFRKALVPLGSEVRIDTTCPTSASSTDNLNYTIKVSAAVDCKRSSLGTTCTPAFEIRGSECGSGRQVFVSNLQRLSAPATDPGGEERALRRLIQRIDAITISDDLRTALKSEIP